MTPKIIIFEVGTPLYLFDSIPQLKVVKLADLKAVYTRGGQLAARGPHAASTFTYINLNTDTQELWFQLKQSKHPSILQPLIHSRVARTAAPAGPNFLSLFLFFSFFFLPWRAVPPSDQEEEQVDRLHRDNELLLLSLWTAVHDSLGLPSSSQGQSRWVRVGHRRRYF